MKQIKRRFVTLIEMMIVMFLIALIIGVVAYNYQGAFDEGKAFKSKAGIEKLQTILNLAVAQDPSLLDDLSSNWQEIVRGSPLVKNPEGLIHDGWGEEYEVEVTDGKIVVRSQKFTEYRRTHQTLFKDES